MKWPSPLLLSERLAMFSGSLGQEVLHFKENKFIIKLILIYYWKTAFQLRKSANLEINYNDMVTKIFYFLVEKITSRINGLDFN